ncbi:hypothetical protein B0G84_0661 [Paraburkholderia sp. BL8N3]|jgi:hypothetical protein|nr:hypothetical protein B0G84_0661 [Paraburkholderia sp. BL8N3]
MRAACHAPNEKPAGRRRGGFFYRYAVRFQAAFSAFSSSASSSEKLGSPT